MEEDGEGGDETDVATDEERGADGKTVGEVVGEVRRKV